MSIDQERTIVTTINTLDCASEVNISPKPSIMLQDDYENQILQSAITYCLHVSAILSHGDPAKASEYLKGMAFAISQ